MHAKLCVCMHECAKLYVCVHTKLCECAMCVCVLSFVCVCVLSFVSVRSEVSKSLGLSVVCCCYCRIYARVVAALAKGMKPR